MLVRPATKKQHNYVSQEYLILTEARQPSHPMELQSSMCLGNTDTLQTIAVPGKPHIHVRNGHSGVLNGL